MKMIDLARTKADKEAEAKSWKETSTDDMPDYPYGLELHLDHDQLKKLGDPELDAEDMITITAKVHVKSVSATTVNGKKKKSANLQIQKMAIVSEETVSSGEKELYEAE